MAESSNNSAFYWIGRMTALPILSIALIAGAVIYMIIGKTPAFAHKSMIRLFCLTGGRSNDWISFCVGKIRRPYGALKADGLLFGQGSTEPRIALQELRDKGYYVFQSKLPDAICDRLMALALMSSSTICPVDGETTSHRTREVYVRGKPKAVRYDFDTVDLLQSTDVQTLISDSSLARVAQDYLGAKPVIDVLTMWWLTDYLKSPDSHAAQFFHFDMDRPKWIKFFIYLTDVIPTSGPHVFVSGSHRTGGIPHRLLQRGYARLTDEDVLEEYDKSRILEIVAPRGSILAEDTRGLHKGKHVTSGDRLLLQIQFSNCLFGGEYPRLRLDGTQATPGLKQALSQFPRMFSAYFSRSGSATGIRS